MANAQVSIGAQTAAVPSGLPGWILAPILLLLTAGAAIALILAVFGLFAALHIAYGASVERVRPVAPLADRAAERPPQAVAERVILVPVPPPAAEVSREEPEADPEPDSRSNSAGAESHVEPAMAAAEQIPPALPEAAPPGDPPVLASDAPESEAAPQGDSTASVDRAATASAPVLETPAPQAQAKPHHVKRHAVRKRARRTVQQQPANSYGSAFEPMFRSR